MSSSDTDNDRDLVMPLCNGKSDCENSGKVLIMEQDIIDLERKMHRMNSELKIIGNLSVIGAGLSIGLFIGFGLIRIGLMKNRLCNNQ